MKNNQLINIGLLILLFIVSGNVSADTWTIYTNGNEIVDLASHENWLWCATNGGIVRWDTRDMSYRKFTTLDGLPTNGINCIDVGPDGTVWCGTDYGAVRYDGVQWELFTEEDGLFVNMVDSVVIGPDGEVWFSDWSRGDGNFGLSRFDGSKWTTYKYPEDTPVYYVAEMEFGLGGVLYIAGGGGLYKFENDVFTVIDDQLESPVFSLGVSQTGVIWCSYNNNVRRYDDSGIMTFIDFRAQDIVIDHEDVAWLGYSDDIVSHNGSRKEYHFPERYCTALEVMDDGTVWAGFSSSIIAKFDNGSWKEYSVNDGLPSNYISWIAQAPDNRMLIGTSAGLSWFDGQEFSIYDNESYWRYLSTLSGAVDEYGNIWLGDGLALNYIENRKWTTISHKEYMGGQKINSIVLDKTDTVWLATVQTAMLPVGHGVSHYDGESWTNYTEDDGLAGNWIQALIVASDGSIWAGGKSRYEGVWDKIAVNKPAASETYGGISRFDGSSWKTWRPEDGLIHYDVTSLAAEESGHIWCGTSHGVSHFDGVTFTNYTTTDGLVNDHVNTVAVDTDGSVWFGTKDGVSMFDGDNWTIYSTADGLPDYVVKDIMIDSEGTIYFLTDHGFSTCHKSTVGVNSNNSEPEFFIISNNYPNPFNSSTTIEYSIPSAADIILSVYSISGQKLATLVDGFMSAGRHSVIFEGTDFASGLYFYRLEAEGTVKTAKMLLLK